MNSRKKLLSLLLSCILLTLLLQGCGSSAKTTANDATCPPPTVSSTSTPTAITTGSETAALKSEPTSWSLVAQSKIDHKTNISGFLNENQGLTVGYAGEIHYTSDGGKTWPNAQNNSLCRFGLELVDESLAWCCGNGGNVRVTTDGGKTWSAVTDNPSAYKFISFIDKTTGWAGKPDSLTATKDGGKTWSNIKLPEGSKQIAAISLSNSTTGYVLDISGFLFCTTDGGKTWSKQDLGFPKLNIKNIDGKKDVLDNSSMATAAVRFTDSSKGNVVFSVCTGKDGFNTFSMQTVDGGKSWNTEKLPKNSSLKMGANVYLSRDAKFLTLWNQTNVVCVYKYAGK